MSDKIFVKDEVSPSMEEVEKRVDKNLTIPPEYKKFTLSSNGKLSIPAQLHFKDYNFDDALKLGMTDDEDMLSNLIQILNGCVFEDIDCANFHEKEMEEVLLNMFFNFWGKTLEKAYPYKDEELESIKKKNPEKYSMIVSGKTIPTVELSVKDLSDFSYLPDNFKEPICIRDDLTGNTYKFMFPRLKHLLIAKEHSDQKFFQDQMKFAKLEEDLKFNRRVEEEGLTLTPKEINQELYSEYKKMSQEKVNDFLMVRQALLISGMNSKECNTLSERLDVYPKIGLHVWQIFNKIVEDYSFGVKQDIQVISPITGEKVTCTFQLEFVDLLPSNDVQHSDGYSVSFGN